MTSVSPRRPVWRRLSRRIAGPLSTVSSMWARAAPSQARIRLTTRSSLGRGLPRRRDAATGLRIIDAIVIHPGDDADELLLHLVDLTQGHRPGEAGVHLVDLTQGHRRFVELTGVQLVAH